MGYRSNIRICIEQEFTNHIIETLTILNSDDFNWFLNKLKSPDYQNKHGIFISFDWIKWNPKFDSNIEYLQNLLRSTDYNKINFIRMGENWEDIEIFGEFNKVGELDIERIIHFEKGED